MQTRPSDLYCVGQYPDDPIKFWFDRAVVNFGISVETDIQRVADGQKNEKASKAAAHSQLLKWLDFDGKMTNQRFAAPPITKVSGG